MTSVKTLQSPTNTQRVSVNDPRHAIHLICKSIGLRYAGLTAIDRSRREWLSEAWSINNGDPTNLVGGWLYFHDSSNSRSTLAARILEVMPLVSDTGRPLVAFRVQRQSVRDVSWRGAKASRRVHNGGIVVASLGHELDQHAQ